ncbi:MAG TPA: hypothetical protein VI759_00570 [Dehalococcoidia bacterium]|nr:hypothetical protein [Dehalococcoidia bacterium]
MDAQRLRSRFWRTASLFGLVALAVTAALAASAFSPAAKPTHAQLVECRSELLFCLTIAKETTSGNGNFDFIIDFGMIPKQPAVVVMAGDEFTLNDNEFQQYPSNILGVVQITELVTPGWRLVDIECARSSNVVGWTFVGENSVILEFNQQDGVISIGGEEIDTILPNSEAAAICIFINEPVERNNVSGAFPALGNAAKKNQTAAAGAAQAAAAPAGTLKPPSTGDAGLAAEDRSHDTLSIALTATFLVAIGGVTWIRARAGRPR